MISRKNTSIQIANDDSLLNSVKRINEGAIMGLVGIMNVAGLNFLAVIDKAQVVGQLNNININKVAGVSLLPFKEGKISAEIVEMLDATKAMLEDGFYFSYGYDVTCSRQRRLKFIE